MAAALSNYIATHRPFPPGGAAARPRRIYHHHHRDRRELPSLPPFLSTARSTHLKVVSCVGKIWAAESNSNSLVVTTSNAVVVPSQRATAADHPVDRIESAKFQLTLWGDHFLTAKANCATDDDRQEVEWREYEAMKEEVKKMVTTDEITAAMVIDDIYAAITEKLRLIDAIQRLGIGYHFETEIEEALEKVYVLGGESFIENCRDHIDLYHASLWFRVLRQHGFRVSPDGFRKFKDDEGKFKESLALDERGLLSLYDASHIAFRGEDILDEAMSFAIKNLESNIVPNHQSSPSIYNSLCFPVWKCVPRSLARHSIDVSSHDQTVIVKFAKLDFNRLQEVYREELHQLSLWWTSLEVPTKFPYARDRLVECYYWSNGVYFEPKYRLSRIILTKFAFVATILDDVYDNFGNYDELEILTEAIEQRWDVSCLEAVPDTMKDIYVIIVNLYEDIVQQLSATGHSTYGVDYSKAEFKRLCRSFLAETRWRTEGIVPTPEEYITHAKITSTFPLLCTLSFLGIGEEIATREAFEWVTNESNKMVTAASLVCRLQNDIVSRQLERKREHVASAVECYMRQHDVSEEKAINVVWGEISNAWKDMAEELQKPTPFPVALMHPILNAARVMALAYENADAYTNSHHLKAHIASLFANPVPL